MFAPWAVLPIVQATKSKKNHCLQCGALSFQASKTANVMLCDAKTERMCQVQAENIAVEVSIHIFIVRFHRKHVGLRQRAHPHTMSYRKISCTAWSPSKASLITPRPSLAQQELQHHAKGRNRSSDATPSTMKHQETTNAHIPEVCDVRLKLESQTCGQSQMPGMGAMLLACSEATSCGQCNAS